MKVGIVGAGAAGSACLLSVAVRGSAREVVLVNRNRKRAEDVVDGRPIRRCPFAASCGARRRLFRFDQVLRSAGCLL